MTKRLIRERLSVLLQKRVILLLPLFVALPAAFFWPPAAVLAALSLVFYALQKRQIKPAKLMLRGSPISSRMAAGQAVYSACLVIKLDGSEGLLARFGRSGQHELQSKVLERLKQILRAEDYIDHLGQGALVVILSPARRLELNVLLQLALRVQDTVSPPFALGGMTVKLSCSVGFCSASYPDGDNRCDLLEAAQEAAEEAARNGPAGIRAWAPNMTQTRETREAQQLELSRAFIMGEIKPFFQPQVSCLTGEITGLEALARWDHPIRGWLPPSEFLGWIEANDMYDRLGATMLEQSLAALAKWDENGLHVPSVSVNFSAIELRNPLFVANIKEALARHRLAPERLTVEILETVIVETNNDALISNIAEIAALGCGLDLDDFGTGHASIAAIRRFKVRRLKIDRSFVMSIDKDPEQQRLVAAVISLAEGLNLDTLAEGVETPEIKAQLLALKCGHIQGFGIARPMAFKETQNWLENHHSQSRKILSISTMRA